MSDDVYYCKPCHRNFFKNGGVCPYHDESNTPAVKTLEAERDDLKARVKEWQAQCVENLQALGAATQNNGVLRAQLETAKGLLGDSRIHGDPRTVLQAWFRDVNEFLSSKEGEE